MNTLRLNKLAGPIIAPCPTRAEFGLGFAPHVYSGHRSAIYVKVLLLDLVVAIVIDVPGLVLCLAVPANRLAPGAEVGDLCLVTAFVVLKLAHSKSVYSGGKAAIETETTLLNAPLPVVITVDMLRAPTHGNGRPIQFENGLVDHVAIFVKVLQPSSVSFRCFERFSLQTVISVFYWAIVA